MKPTFFRPQILQQNVQMDGSINFMTNGDIVDADGRTRVKRYNDGLQGPKHDVLYETPHGAVKITRPLYRSDNGRRRLKDEYVYVTFKFPKKYGLALTKVLYEEEADQILSYLKTRKEETIWK